MLPVTLAGVKLLCGIGDTSQDAGITALIALQQAALEYALDPAVLANSAGDAGLLATLTLGATECLAGGWLAAQGRQLVAAALAAAGAATQETFRLSTLEISTRPLPADFAKADLVKIGAGLLAQGVARLSPFTRSARSLARTAAGGDALLDDQSPVPLLIGAGLGTPVAAGQGPPADGMFDAVLGTDGQTEPPGGDIFGSPFFGIWNGGPEP